VFAKKYKKKEKQYTDKIFLRIKNSNKPTNDKILMPITFVSNFNKHYDFPRSSDYIFYYREIFNFLENINKEISDKLVLRLMPNTKKKNFFIKILNKNFPHIKYEIPNKNINESLKNYSFFIGSINSTTILQAMLSGIPLIIFMNKDYFMPSNNFKKCYDLLKKNHIMFDNGKSAANFLNFEFNSKKSWYSAGGKNARKHFIKNILYKDFKL
jgi:putative transferase (TIGR04331 family)